MKFELKGVPELRRAMERAGELGHEGVKAGLVNAAEEILAQSVPLAPIDRGTLRGSAGLTADSPKDTGNTVTVTFGYGGAAASYAVVQHERTDYVHTDGQAKFLERPLLAYAGHFGQSVARHVEAFVRRVRG